jgi:hypothetical protein
MQFIKGGFSYRLKREFGYLGEVWQRGFSELRVEDRESYVRPREYIAQNPVRAGWVDSPEKFPYCLTYLAKRKPQGLNRLRKKSRISGAKHAAEKLCFVTGTGFRVCVRATDRSATLDFCRTRPVGPRGQTSAQPGPCFPVVLVGALHSMRFSVKTTALATLSSVAKGEARGRAG